MFRLATFVSFRVESFALSLLVVIFFRLRPASCKGKLLTSDHFPGVLYSWGFVNTLLVKPFTSREHKTK